MRIAFLTPEFVTDLADGGGLANYLNRISRLLVEEGHEVEVFTKSSREPGVLMHGSVRVERVAPAGKSIWNRATRRLCGIARLGYPYALWAQARALAKAMDKRHHQKPFDIVQSADYFAVGLGVRHALPRRHLVRCSSAADLYNEVDGRNSRAERWRVKLEFASMRRADAVYAPSRFVAEHLQEQLGIRVEVVPPPFKLETAPAAERPFGLPSRYFVHFGHLNRRKGTHWLAEALPRALAAEPEMRMVWIGRGNWSELSGLLEGLGSYRSRVQVLYPLPKPELYAVVRDAEAAVLPSVVDNLPNTVIESLMLGTPVIGTRGASIDELVEQDVHGELVSLNDVEELTAALLRVWRGQSRARKGFSWNRGQAALAGSTEALLELGRSRVLRNEDAATVST